ncbi:MAG: hypothetical protein PHC66_01670 [Candidatus Nanoarchaeia archaeon]|nr:hypothetical protein [Candidatus Nanoarchaeia archaeon]MDD5238920.1 hypothetical protein [Candidatus Nanoarchaeia archaeon]
MKRLAFMAVALFALIFALGCTGGDKTEEAGTGQGYSMTVSPTDTITGSPVTIDLRLENIFDKDMTGVTVRMKDVSSIYNKDGELTTGTTIIKGQTYPVIMTLSSDRAGTISGKHVEVCFDYDTEYYFDIGLKSKSQAAEELAVESGASSGPLGVAVVGLENVFYENLKGTGALTLSNEWQGTIKEIKSVSAEFPVGSYVRSGAISISGCTGTTAGGVTTVKSTDTGCSILSNDVAIANGLTLRTEVDVNATQTALTVERTVGNVIYNYCYDIDLPTLTIKSV